MTSQIYKKTEEKTSPEYMQMSLAAAITLGLENGRFYRDAKLHCLNLLLTYDEGCYANCAYCGLSDSREGQFSDKSFIRVDWPVAPMDEIVERAKDVDHLERACISMVNHPEAKSDTLNVLEQLDELDVPVSILSNPTQLEPEEVSDFHDAGADTFTVAVDAANPDVFEALRGRGVNGPHDWDHYWNVLEAASESFGDGSFGTHLIVGMGETEEEMVETIQRVRDMGGETHLFAFYPEDGSNLEDLPPVPHGQFRRIQLARYIIDHDMATAGEMEFDDEGRVRGFGLEGESLDRVIDMGNPFQTSGCSGETLESACNRPFGDGPPSDIKSYPFELTEEDVAEVREQLFDYDSYRTEEVEAP